MSIRSFGQLYVKDMRKLYKLFLVLLAIQAGYIFYLLDTSFFHTIFTITDIFVRNSRHYQIASIIKYASIFIFPFMFLYSWFSEETARTNYQLFSLPVQNRIHLESKMAAVFTLGIIWIIGWAIFANLSRAQFSNASSETPLILRISYIYRYFENVGSLFMLMGITSIVTGCVQAMKRYRLVAGTVVFISLCAVYFLIGRLSVRPLEIVVNYFIRDITQFQRILSGFLIALSFETIILFTGVACIYLGFYLFEKFSEV
ncbi:hypothetical protein ACFL6P_05920 [Candidatus Latescibacterota bacterium]